MELKIGCPPEVWRSFIADSPQGSVFADDRLLQSAGLQVELVTVESRGKIVLGCPLLSHEGSLVDQPWPFLQYHGPLLSADICSQPGHRASHQQLQAADVFLEHLEKSGDRVWFNFHPQYPDVRAFSWFHYHDEPQQKFRFRPLYTGIVDLSLWSSVEEYISSIRELRARQYKRAARSGYNVRRSQDLDELENLHRLTFERQGIERDPRDIRIMRQICAAALAEGYGDLFFSHNENGACVSGAFFLRDQSTAYYLIGANDPEHRQGGASTHLLIEVFWIYRNQGVRFIDLVGINSPSRGDYKTSLNASPHLYLQALWGGSEL